MSVPSAGFGRSSYDAIVVGSGPNGLAAAIELARDGRSVAVVEGSPTVGGGMRTLPLTRPGFRHDICSSIHPMAVASPFFRSLPLDKHGLEWVHPPAPLAHPLPDGTAVVLERSVEATAAGLGDDADAYRKLLGPLVDAAEVLFGELLRPFRLPRHPFAAARFGWQAMRSVKGLADRHFRGERAKALVAGNGGHAVLPLDQPPGAAIALMLNIAAHAVGWPFPRGGAQALADALAGHLRSLGGEVITGHPVRSVQELPQARVVLLDVTPRQVVELAGPRLTAGYRRRLGSYRYGPAAFKLDYALRAPIPWKAADCFRAATVHVGGTLDEIAASERAAWEGRVPERPFVLVAQHTLFDPTRAPAGQHTAWAYCHVPNGCTEDMTGRIEAQIERFAPGFRDCILERVAHAPADLERYNPNYIGGDIVGGAQSFSQLLTRPVASLNPYATSDPAIFICSASTPPGGGVHGMCGYFAAQAARLRLS